MVNMHLLPPREPHPFEFRVFRGSPLRSPLFSQFPDTVFKLNHSDSSEPGAVNKFAAAEAKTVNKPSNIAKTLPSVKAVTGRMPHHSARSLCYHPARVYRRKPAQRRGPVQKAEGNCPPEGRLIRVDWD